MIVGTDGHIARSPHVRPPEISALVSAVPLVAGAVEQFEKEWADDPDGPGLYLYTEVIFGYLDPLLENQGPIDSGFFDWLEGLATSPRVETRNFLKAGLLEVMGDNPAWLARLRTQMKSETVRLSRETEVFLGRPEPGNQ
jgi:hypothetical protein